ncbi:MAG TPA: thioesterase family protein [Geminicoccaceae bacterium]|nr:thioesterase family protein [Geminicoccaceae bacterium]
MDRPPPPSRADYRWFSVVPTRWMDNDVYGHVNNVNYYSFFDTAIAHFLMREAGLDPWRDPIIDVAVETGCRFHRSMAFPDLVHAGLRIGRLGTSSVRWEIGLFRNEEDTTSADGHFVHVFVERSSQRPVPIPETVRAALARLVAAP